MPFFVTDNNLSEPAKMIALQNLRKLAASYKAGKNPVGETKDEKLLQMKDTWDTAMQELVNAFALPDEVPENARPNAEAALWNQLFSEGGTLAQWEAKYQGSLIALEERVAGYQGGTITEQVEKEKKVKEWNVGSVLYDLKRDFSSIIGISRAYDAEMGRTAREANLFKDVDKELARDVTFNADIRQKEAKNRKKLEELAKNPPINPPKNPPEPVPLLTETDIVDLWNVGNFAEFEALYNKRAELPEEFNKELKQRVEAIEGQKVNKNVSLDEVDKDIYTRKMKNFLKPRIQTVRKVLDEAAETDEMKEVFLAESYLKDAKEQTADLDKRIRELERKIDDGKKALEDEVDSFKKDFDKKWGDTIAYNDKRIRNLTNLRTQNGTVLYVQQLYNESKDALKKQVDESRKKIDQLKNMNPEDKDWQKLLNQSIEVVHEEVFETLMGSMNGFYDPPESEQELYNKLDKAEEDAYKAAHSKWEDQVNELSHALKNEEINEINRMIGSVKRDYSKAGSEKNDLEEELEDYQQRDTRDRELVGKYTDQLNKLKKDREQLMQGSAGMNELLKNEKDRLLKEQKLVMAEEAKTKPSGFKTGEWNDLLTKVKEQQIEHAYAKLAADNAMAAANRIQNEEKVDERTKFDTGIKWRIYSLKDLYNSQTLSMLERAYCQNSVGEDREAKEAEFEKKLEEQRNLREQLITMTTTAFSAYTKVNEGALIRQIKEGKSTLEKYGSIPVQVAASAEGVESYRTQSEGQSVDMLTKEIERYQWNAETLMYGARVYELKQNGDNKNLKAWMKELDKDERKQFLEKLTQVTEHENSLRLQINDLNHQKKELDDSIKEKLAAMNDRAEPMEKLQTEIKQYNEQMEGKKALHSNILNTAKELNIERKDITADELIDASTKLSVFGENVGLKSELKSETRNNLAELLKNEPIKGQATNERVEQLRKLKTDFEQAIKKKEAGIREGKVHDYIAAREQEHNELEMKFNNDKELWSNAEKQYELDVKKIADENKELLAEKQKGIDEIEKDLKPLKEDLAQTKVDRAGLENHVKSCEKEVNDLKQDYLPIVKQYEGARILLNVYAYEADLVLNTHYINKEIEGRERVLDSVDKLKEKYDAVVNKENTRIDGIENGIPAKMLANEKQNLLQGFNHFVETANVGREKMDKANSEDYNKMHNALASFQTEFNNLTTTDQVKEKLNFIKQQAQSYIHVKENQFPHTWGFYSDQARIRIDYANRVIDFCNKGIQRMNDFGNMTQEMQAPFENSKMTKYQSREAFYNGYIKEQMEKRSDKAYLDKESEWRCNTQEKMLHAAEVFEADDLAELRLEAINAAGKVAAWNYEEKVLYTKGQKHTFVAIGADKDVAQWIRDYKRMNVDRAALEKDAGVDKILDAPVDKKVKQKQLQQKAPVKEQPELNMI